MCLINLLTLLTYSFRHTFVPYIEPVYWPRLFTSDGCRHAVELAGAMPKRHRSSYLVDVRPRSDCGARERQRQAGDGAAATRRCQSPSRDDELSSIRPTPPSNWCSSVRHCSPVSRRVVVPSAVYTHIHTHTHAHVDLHTWLRDVRGQR